MRLLNSLHMRLHDRGLPVSRTSVSCFGLVRPDIHRVFRQRPQLQCVPYDRQVAPGLLHLPTNGPGIYGIRRVLVATPAVSGCRFW